MFEHLGAAIGWCDRVESRRPDDCEGSVELRRTRDLTQEQLGRRAGLPQAYISQLESGVRAKPSAAIVKRLARALGVSVTELLE